MKGNRRVNSIARRIHLNWQWKKFWIVLWMNVLALAVCAAAYLYANEVAVTGDFVLRMARRVATETGRPGDLTYFFTWQEAEHAVALGPFIQLVRLFGRPVLIVEGVFWVLGFLGGARRERRLLRPLEKLTQSAQRLTDAASRPEMARPEPVREGVDEEKFHSLEHAIEQIDIGGRLSTGDRELKGLEDAINDLLSRMHAAYRQQAQFVSDASHELRTPISVIQGYVRMLERWGRDDKKVLDESIAAIRSETDHMKTLVEQLLFLARGDSGRTQMNPEPMDLSALMKEVLEEYRMIDADHDWQQGRLESAPVEADPALIKQAARVLVDNAVRYTPQGEPIRLGAGSAGGEAFLEVQDGGIGIDAEDLPRIFDRFYRADPARARQSGGTGLGLSIAKWIVDRHGGHFEVTSMPGIGTRIRVYLPLQAARAQSA